MFIYRSIDTDDFQGECDNGMNFDTFSDYRPKPKVNLKIPKRTEKNYPLLRTLNEAIEITLDEMTQEINLDISNQIPSGGGQSDTQSDKDNSSSRGSVASSTFIIVLVAIIFLGKL